MIKQASCHVTQYAPDRCKGHWRLSNLGPGLDQSTPTRSALLLELSSASPHRHTHSAEGTLRQISPAPPELPTEVRQDVPRKYQRTRKKREREIPNRDQPRGFGLVVFFLGIFAWEASFFELRSYTPK